jgi:hypothetical protein
VVIGPPIYLHKIFATQNNTSVYTKYYSIAQGLPFTDYDPEQARLLLRQEQFAPYTVVNAVLRKSWRLKDQYPGVFLSLNSLLNQSYKTGGFEQSRNANYIELLQEIQADKRRFGPKYWYGRGTTYFLNMYLRF